MKRSLPPTENELQLSVNNFWLCILGNICADWLQPFINEVLAAFQIKIIVSGSLPHPANEHQPSVTDFLTCKYGN
jgi:hypothetical protein